jgi:hypothetical protein
MRGWWGLRGGYERGGGEIVGARGMGWGMAGEKGGGGGREGRGEVLEKGGGLGWDDF